MPQEPLFCTCPLTGAHRTNKYWTSELVPSSCSSESHLESKSYFIFVPSSPCVQGKALWPSHRQKGKSMKYIPRETWRAKESHLDGRKSLFKFYFKYIYLYCLVFEKHIAFHGKGNIQILPSLFYSKTLESYAMSQNEGSLNFWCNSLFGEVIMQFK